MDDDIGGEVIWFPRAKEHYWHRDGAIDLADIDKLIWAVCPYLRDLKPCGGCPAKEEFGNGRVGVRACRSLAQEAINICQTGHPHRKVR